MFSLEEGERGETDVVELHIDTGDAHPKSQPPQCVPFAVRQEIACQLRQTQTNGVVQPSKSPWASPIVLVRKDSSLRFCIDYRSLIQSRSKINSLSCRLMISWINWTKHSSLQHSILQLATGRSKLMMPPERKQLLVHTEGV